MKSKQIKRALSILLTLIMISSLSFSTNAQQPENDDQFDSIFMDADLIEETKNGTLYYYDEFDGTVLKSIDKNQTTTLTIEEADHSTNVVKVSKDDSVYLNGNQIVIDYENLGSETEEVVSPRLTTRYFESDSGNPSLYTVPGPTESVANIHFQSQVGNLTVTIVLGVIGFLTPGISFTTGVAAGIISVFAASNTTDMSCKIRHYYQPGWPNGWNAGSFAEKIVTTWYAGVNYTGPQYTTTHYRTGYLY